MQYKDSISPDLLEGRKNIDLRLNCGKWREIQVGDEIVSNFLARIIRIKRYSSFSELIQDENLERILPPINLIEESLTINRQSFQKEEINQYGIIALELMVVF